jgi:hypothetical protein
VGCISFDCFEHALEEDLVVEVATVKFDTTETSETESLNSLLFNNTDSYPEH